MGHHGRHRFRGNPPHFGGIIDAPRAASPVFDLDQKWAFSDPRGCHFKQTETEMSGLSACPSNGSIGDDHVGPAAPLPNMPADRNAPANKGELNMKLAPKILAASLFAATPFWLAGPVHAVPMGAGLGLKDAVTPLAEAVRGGGGRVGGGGGRVGGAGRPGGIGGVGGVGRPGGIGGVGGVGRPGGVGGIGGIAGVGGPGRWNGAGGWNGGYWRPGYGLAAGAVGGAIAAGSYYGGYGYGNYGYDNYGYGYDTGAYASSPGYADYCAQRYKSYDPASGTYLGYDGIRHPCP
jgi:BA14K-like protein